MVAKSIDAKDRTTCTSHTASIGHIYTESVNCPFLGLTGIIKKPVSSKTNDAFSIGENEITERRNQQTLSK